MNRLIAKYRAWTGKSSNSRIIFIIGCGRSGTHWVGYILKKHPDIHVTVEKPYIFNSVTSMALDPKNKKRLFQQLIRAYRFEHALVAPRQYADKSHPNIWIAEEIAGVFPNALFIGIQRNPYATVASMLKHRGVLSWQERWKEFPVPNSFLGITTSNVEEYEKLSLAAKCALRWRSHAERMDYLRAILGPKLHVIKYEDLIERNEQEMQRLTEFLMLTSPIPLPEVKRQSLDRWRSELSQETCAAIAQIVGDNYSFS